MTASPDGMPSMTACVVRLNAELRWQPSCREKKMPNLGCRASEWTMVRQLEDTLKTFRPFIQSAIVHPGGGGVKENETDNDSQNAQGALGDIHSKKK